ncbi:MAG: serine--tRNA ligase [Bdellovibrionota bacterium]|nr:serine--tRNA ligase [Bdellovibrionota bacterium]
MHDIKNFENNVEEVKSNLSKRNFDLGPVEDVLLLNGRRKELIQFVETKRAEIKRASKEIGMLKKNGDDASSQMAKVSELKKSISEKDHDLEQVENQLKETLSIIPNLLASDVPQGKDEEDNIEVRKWGNPREFAFPIKDHVELGENLGQLDFERGAKLTGSRFVVLRGELARLERALINFFIDEHLKKGYEEVLPPFIVNDEALYGTGQLPKFEEDLFKLRMEGRNWYLIPTAEVPLTNLRKDELFKKEELPQKFCAYTPCFRSEAGSHGKDTRGLIRLHQFNKVEMVYIVDAESSEAAHNEMVAQARFLLEKLELPYREILLCGGDIGFGARRCIDFEVWLPGQDKYREISSVSNCWDFQARRANIRYRNDEGKPTFAHTLNGSGLAVGRPLVAIMENYQKEDGSIQIPKVLQGYMGGTAVINKR